MRARTRNGILLGLLGAVLIVAAGFGGWLLRGSGGDDVAVVKVGVPTIVTAAQLDTFATDHYPLYWAGERRHTRLELTLTSTDAIFVRYLPEGAHAGDKARYLTVGTYRDLDGYTALTATKKNVADVVAGQDGAVIAVFRSRPESTYFSFKNASFQVEVFSPHDGESKKLTDDGSVKLVGGTG